MEEKKEDRCCLKCGKLILNTTGKGTGSEYPLNIKKFCNSYCRIEYYKDKNAQPSTFVNCIYCGKSIKQHGLRVKKYCSQDCTHKWRWANNPELKKRNLLNGQLRRLKINNNPSLLKQNQEYYKQRYQRHKNLKGQQDINTNNLILNSEENGEEKEINTEDKENNTDKKEDKDFNQTLQVS